jgi:hypothetical protein
MRFMVFVKANADTEAEVLPTEAQMTEMMAFNEALAAAGVIKDGDGLQPTAKGARVMFSGEQRSIVRGPFGAPGETVAGYWLWECESLDAAIEWAKRCPNPTGNEGQLEIRPFFEMDDFGDAATPELRAQEDALRQRLHGE